MKDYESYRNNGNKDIPDNTKLKKIEFCNMQFQDNKLPGEYFDIRENALECDLNDDDKFASNPNSEKSSANTKTDLDDVQELSNAVNSGIPQASGSIVESAGAIATGTATVVVGASAAIVAFNAVNKVQPKMVINSLDSGSSYVHYNLELSNLDLDKDYDIVVKNSQQEFRLDCTNGINDDYVYNLKPGLQYSLSLVSYHELLGEIEYASKTFYTLKSDEILGYSDIEVIYNSDLTCGIEYSSTFVDDKNQMGDTYIVVKCEANGFGEGEEMIIFHSLYQGDFDDPENYTYSYSKTNKTHKGSIKEVPAGIVSIELYQVNEEDPEAEGKLIAVKSKEVVYPLEVFSGSNYGEFTGSYNLIKDVKDINVKKDNLVVKLNLYNDENEVTKFEENLDISENKFYYRQLVKKDTTAYTYQVGYYKADNSFVVVKESERLDLYGGYFDAYYYKVSPSDEDYIDVKWTYDSDGYEYANITLKTGFDNYGNTDAFYRAELLKMDYSITDGENHYIVLGTYEGTGDAVFDPISIGEFNREEGYYEETDRYTFRYTSLLRYYVDDDTTEIVEVENTEPIPEYDGLIALDPSVYFSSDDFQLLSNGKVAFNIYMEESSMEEGVSKITFDNDSIKLKIYYFENDYNVITDTVEVKDAEIVSNGQEAAYLAFDLTCPSSKVHGYYAEYEFVYHDRYGGNDRILQSYGKKLFGDMHYKVVPRTIDRLQKVTGVGLNLRIEFATFMPSDYSLLCKDSVNYIYGLHKENGNYVFDNAVEDETTFIFTMHNDTDNYDYTEGGYTYTTTNDLSSEGMGLNDLLYERFGINDIVYTYNNDGTININLLTGFEEYYEDYEYEYYVDYTLYRTNDLGYQNEADHVLKSKASVINFNSADSLDEPYGYYDTFFIEYVVHKVAKNVAYGNVVENVEFGPMRTVEFTASNGYSLSDEYDVKPTRYSDPDYSLMFVVMNTLMYPQDQYVTFSADGVTSMSFKLEDAKSGAYSADGTTYYFTLSQELYEQAIINFKVKANYTLTEEKLIALGDNYTGSLYKEFEYQILGA